MTFPYGKADVEVGVLVNGVWVEATDVGGGVRIEPITMSHGRANWSARAETGSASFTMDNRDGRWSPDYASGAYAGDYRRNLPTRIGVGHGDPYLEPDGTDPDVVSTPDVLGAGGGAPTAPTFVSATESAETTYVVTHDCSLPATLAAGDRLLLLAHAGHESLTPADQGGGVTDLDDWTLVDESNLYTPWDAFAIYEIGPLSAAEATALAGDTVQFSTTTGARSSFQVIRTSGCRSGGQGVAWDYALDSPPRTFGSTPNPPSLTAPWGADEHRWYAIAWYASNGESATGTPWVTNYTNVADGNTTALVQIATAHRTTSAATEDPGAFTLSGDENWLAMTFVYRAPEDASGDGVLDITGDIDLRIEFQLHQDPVDIDEGGDRIRLAHKTSGANGWEWELYYALGNVVSTFSWRDSSGVAQNYTTQQTGAALPLSVQHDRVALRFGLDVSTGAGSFYTSDAIGGTWTQLGSDATGVGATSIKSNDAPLRVAGNPADANHIPLPGKVFAFELRNEVGTEVANPDFTAEAVGTTSFVDAAGRTWTLGAGGRITDQRWRFHGELASLPVRWDVQGRDVRAPVEAAGLFRRLRQGDRLLQSALRRAILNSATNLVQYWPLEETGTNVTRFGAAKGTAPMKVVGGFPNAAANSSFAASSPIPTFGATTFVATVDSYTGTDAWQIRWLQSIPDNFTGDDLQYMIVSTTDMTWIVTYRDDSAGQHQLLAFRGSTLVYDSGWVAFNATGTDRRMTLAVVQNGSTVDAGLEVQTQDEPSATGFFNTSVVAGSAGAVTQIRMNRNLDVNDWAVGHVTLQNAKTPSTELATELDAYDGELAALRIMRLCREEGIKTRIEGDPNDTEVMGQQGAGTLMDLLEECANTDLGILHESREALAIGYRTRASMVDQTAASTIALDYSAGEVAGPLEPDRDDQGFHNDITMVNATGGEARAVLDDGSTLSISEPPVGAGQYDTSFAVNGQDNRLQAMADTRLALSAVDEPRISRLPLALHHNALAQDDALVDKILDASLGDKITVANNLPVALGTTTVAQLIQGTREQIESHKHNINLLTSPASPWETGGVDPPTADRSVTFRTQQALSTPGTPPHVLTALGYTDTAKITRAQLDGILDDWVASTGGTTRNVTSAATWTTALAAAQPGDLVRITSTITGSPLNARASKFSLSGSNMSDGQPGLPIILTCADGVYNDPNNTSNGDVGLDLQNCSHVWAVGFNVRNSQFGIRGQNWGGTAGFHAYIAYCQAENLGHNGIQVQGWFQALTSSGGTVPTETEIASPGLDWGYSEFFVVEENTVDGTGVIADAFGEAFYFGTGTGGGGWHGFCRDFWVRGNSAVDWTSDAYDVKPGCYRGRFTDNEYSVGYAVSGAPFQLCLVVTANSSRPSWFDFDPQIYVEGNRGWDSNLTSTNGSSDNIMGYIGLSGMRIANNITWSNPQTGTFAHWRARNQKGTNDTEALAEFRNDPTWIVNQTAWGADSFQNAGYGDPLVAVFPGTIDFDLRNNIVDNASPATGEVDAAASDFTATVPAIGVAGDAEWLTYGPGSAFDLDPDSALVFSGESIADLALLIDRDITGRVIPAIPNPGAFQPFDGET